MKRTALVWIAALALLAFTPGAHAATIDVTVLNFTFDPAQVTINPGDTVRWTNAGGLHNVRADDDSFRCANGCDGSGGNGAPSTAAWEASVVFNDPGDNPYYCEQHGGVGGSGMAGLVMVAIFLDGFEGGNTDAWSNTNP